LLRKAQKALAQEKKGVAAMSEERTTSEGKPGPARDQGIEQFLETLPRGIKQQVESMRSLQDGLLYPSTAIRYWQEHPDDGLDWAGSKSSWVAIAFTADHGVRGRYASMLTEALRRSHPKTHFEVWSLLPYHNEQEPYIINHVPELGSDEAFHGKIASSSEITELDIRDFVRDYVIDYYQLHPSNHRFIEILECGHHVFEPADRVCRVNFSASGDNVTLTIRPTSRGLEVSYHDYGDWVDIIAK
jgi:hypothetical protein